MLLPTREDTIHASWMYRVLTEIADAPDLVSLLRFKGGTYAAMRGALNRFSVDLDFDLVDETKQANARTLFEKIFHDLELEIKEQSVRAPQYFLRYPAPEGKRNTLRIDVAFPAPRANEYEPVQLQEIDRILLCQTIPTMVSNKLLAPLERFEKHNSIAGRDLFDIHAFLVQGFAFKPEIIEEKRSIPVQKYIGQLSLFIEEHFTQTIIDQDLNTLLYQDVFRSARKHIKQESIAMLRNL